MTSSKAKLHKRGGAQDLPEFTRFLVQQGLLYWIVLLVFTIVALVMLVDESVSPM